MPFDAPPTISANKTLAQIDPTSIPLSSENTFRPATLEFTAELLVSNRPVQVRHERRLDQETDLYNVGDGICGWKDAIVESDA